MLSLSKHEVRDTSSFDKLRMKYRYLIRRFIHVVSTILPVTSRFCNALSASTAWSSG